MDSGSGWTQQLRPLPFILILSLPSNSRPRRADLRQPKTTAFRSDMAKITARSKGAAALTAQMLITSGIKRFTMEVSDDEFVFTNEKACPKNEQRKMSFNICSKSN